MKDIAFYDSAASQLDAISMDSSPHASADGHFLCDDVALNLCAISDQNARAIAARMPKSWPMSHITRNMKSSGISVACPRWLLAPSDA